MAKGKDFCDPENISVVIPYKTYEKLVNIANNFDVLESRMKRLEDRLTGLTGIYTDVLQRLGEIKDML